MNKWLKEIYEKCIYEKRLMDARSLDNWELSLWRETFKELYLLEVNVPKDFVENGMFLEKEEIKNTIYNIQYKLKDEAETHKHSSVRYSLCWNCLEHMLVYWT